MGKKIGIDLGTTYSVVSYVDETGSIVNIESAEGDKTTPSVLFFDPSDGTCVVGSNARDSGALNPECLVERVKNYMGDPNWTKTVNGVEYSAAALSSIILKKLISDAEVALQGEEIEGAVITCPAYFGDAARNATMLAGSNVELSNGQKLNVLKIMDEPTAAAIAYGNAQHQDLHETVLIYDLGGGTFDCTVMKLDFEGLDKHYQVITTGGDHQLGGKDWDAKLAEYVVEEFCNQTGADADAMKEDPEVVAFLSEKVEALKKMLTTKPSAKITPSFDGSKCPIEVTREKFDEITSDLFNQTLDLINVMLDKKGLSMNDIDKIIAVGGSTRMPQVKEGLDKAYGKEFVSFDPDKAVSNGAALVASGFNVSEDTNVSSDDKKFSLGDISQETKFEGKGGTTETIVELCTKSYALRVLDKGKPVGFNLVVKDTVKPALGSSLSIGGLILGQPGTMFDSVNIVIRENESLDQVVNWDDCAELYEEEPISFPNAYPGETNVEVQLFVDINGQLNLSLIICDTGEKYELKPKRIGGDVDNLGMDVASAITLG
ncbi:MAG: Hsp70 family protein [Anaeroplasma sp.]